MEGDGASSCGKNAHFNFSFDEEGQLPNHNHLFSQKVPSIA
jgi:hypothetical protein